MAARLRRRTAACVLGGCAALLACEPPPPTSPAGGPPLELRLALERAETAVGEPLALTLELALPAGVVPAAPEPAPSTAFETATLGEWQVLPATAAAGGGQRYALRWTVLARDVGRQRLPALSVPLRWPGGERELVELAALPLEVRSVRSGEQRDAPRDIRAAPPPQQRAALRWLVVTGVLLLAVGGGWRRRRAAAAAAGSAAGREQWADEALGALAQALALADARACAAALGALLRRFAERCHAFDARALTPHELPACVEPELRELLLPLQGERFARSPERVRIEDCARSAQHWLGQQARRG